MNEKLQIPSSKFQRISKPQVPKQPIPCYWTRAGRWNQSGVSARDHWDLERGASLELGVCSLEL